MLKWIKRRRSDYQVEYASSVPVQRLQRLDSLEKMREKRFGERLMCLWEALYALNPQAEATSKRTLERLTQALSESQYICYTAMQFDLRFRGDNDVKYLVYVEYLFGTACCGEVPCHLLLQDIEDVCWKICGPQYTSPHLPESSLRKLWVVFNKLSQVGSCPPVMCFVEAGWLVEQLAELLGIPSLVTVALPSTPVTFKELLTLLDSKVLLRSQPESNDTGVDRLYDWLATEVLTEGWLLKRTRKRGKKWTNWQCRWFVLTPYCLQYYLDEACTKEKGFVEIHSENVLEDLEDINGVIWKYHNRFSIEKKSTKYQIELSAPSLVEKSGWMDVIKLCADARKEGSTVLMQLLNERSHILQDRSSTVQSTHLSLKRQNSQADLEKKVRSYCPHFALTLAREKRPRDQEATAWVRSFRESVACTISDNDLDEDEGDFEGFPSTPEENGSHGALQRRSSDDDIHGRAAEKLADDLSNGALIKGQPDEDLNESDDEHELEVEMEKLKVVFFKIDTDGDGRLCTSEFYAFITNLDVNLTQNETDLIFMTIDKDRDNYISFQEFQTFFMEFVTGDSSVIKGEAKLRAAFMAADRDGNGRINFSAFIEHAFSRRRTMSVRAVARTFEALDHDKSGDICFREFRSFFNRQSLSSSLAPLAQAHDEDAHSPLEGALKDVYKEADAGEIVTYLLNRWDKFKTFKRTGVSGEAVMTGAHGIVNDHLPGDYTLLELACFNDLPPITPRHTVVEGVQWLPSTDPTKSGRVLFPENFNGMIATELATSETLAFYGCSLADGNQLKVSLLYRHGIQDFTYENSYLDDYVLAESRAGIEKHGFAHLDCPLDQDSGRFVIAKIEESCMFITGFKIPTRHTLYVPPDVIHSNDYLRGTWRTMLSDEAHIDHVKLVRCLASRDEHLRFDFEALEI